MPAPKNIGITPPLRDTIALEAIMLPREEEEKFLGLVAVAVCVGVPGGGRVGRQLHSFSLLSRARLVAAKP